MPPKPSRPRNETALQATSPVAGLTGLSGVKVRVTAVLGNAVITFDEAVALDAPSLISLDRAQDDPVDLCVNGDIVARGRLVVVGDTYGVQITELVDRKPRR